MKTKKWLLLLAVFATPLFFASCSDDDELPSYTINAEPNNPAWGTVTGDGVFSEGDTVELTAMPMNDFNFKHWTEVGQTVYIYPSYSFEAKEDRNLVAVFEDAEDDDDNGDDDNGDDDNGDDDNGDAENYFSYDGNTYSLANGFMVEWGQYFGEGYEFEVLLFSEGIQFIEEEGFTGTGNAVLFDLASPDQDGPAAGTYTFDDDDEDPSGDPFTFFWADIILNFDIEEETGTLIGIVEGTIEVEINGSNYSLSLDLVAEDDKPVTGHFSGQLKMLNEALDKNEPARERHRF